ncbi:MAG: signal peptidase I [Clostridiales bacterium]|nr:signal peptidase I [Clostridiales bacterium]MCD7828629.1 signal peptidase I [Clostridiales bacterium]
MGKKIVDNIYEIASVIMTSIIAVALVFIFAFRLVGVSGESMNPTLLSGDWLITTTFNTSYEYEDIVIVVQPGALDEPIVKRVIATEYQWVDVDYDEGVVYVGDSLDNMQALDEPYIAEPASSRPSTDTNEYPIQVPEGCLFVMGDNRNNSTDSRSYLVGFIDERYVLGKAVVRAMAVDYNDGTPRLNTDRFSIYDY